MRKKMKAAVAIAAAATFTAVPNAVGGIATNAPIALAAQPDESFSDVKTAGGQTLKQPIQVTEIDEEAPKAMVNGTNPIEEDAVYNSNFNLKFYDNAALNYYELNGHKNPTNISGNTWGDGNYVNIQGYLLEGKNTLKVWDQAGNSSTYTFTIDRVAPTLVDKIVFTPDNSQTSREKIVSFTASEKIVSPGEGWMEVEGSDGKQWKKIYNQAMKDSITLTDLAGNTSDPIAFEVKRIEHEDLTASVTYSNNGQYTNQDVTVTIQTNVECHTPDGWTQTGNKRNQFEKTYSADTEETVTLVSLGNQTLEQTIQVTGIDKEAPKAMVNGTNPIEEDAVYNSNFNLKFYDNAALDRYELNGHESPTNISGNTWGDGNYVNIQGYLQEGENTLKVWDQAGNFSTYTFTIDRIAPTLVGEITFTPDNGQTSREKTVSFTASEKIVSPGDGWTEVEGSDGKQWRKVYEQAMKDSITLTDLAGNTSDPIAFEVKRIEQEELKATVTYSNNGQYTNQDVTVTIQTNVECQTPEGWTQTGNKRNQFEKTYSADTEETVTLVSLGGQTLEQKVLVTGIDKEAPNVTVEVEKPDEMTPSKIVTLVGDEPFKVVAGDGQKLLFTPENDDDGDGYATIWKASATSPVWEGYTVEDRQGNQSTVGVFVTNVDSLVPKAKVNYTVTEPTDGDVPVEITWNTGLSEAFEQTLEDDGWVKTKEVPPTFVRIFRENETLTYDNVESQSGVPGETLTIIVGNILTEKAIGVNYWDIVNNRQAGEGLITVASDAESVSLSDLTDVPEGYEIAAEAETAQINDGWIYVAVRPVIETAEAVLEVNFVGPFGEDIDVDPVIVRKSGPEGEWAVFHYGEDWEIPEGYEFAEDFDEAAAKQEIRIKYGETLDTLEIGIVPEEEKPVAETVEAVLEVNFVGPFGEDIDVDPVIARKSGPEGEWVTFYYGKDWKIPKGYDFAEDFDEAAAKQEIRIKYGETLDTLEIGIIPRGEKEELQEAALEEAEAEKKQDAAKENAGTAKNEAEIPETSDETEAEVPEIIEETENAPEKQEEIEAETQKESEEKVQEETEGTEEKIQEEVEETEAEVQEENQGTEAEIQEETETEAHETAEEIEAGI